MYILAFRVEVVIYIFLASCVAVLIYGIAYIFADRHKGGKLEKDSRVMREYLLQKIERQKQGEALTEAEQKKLVNRLGRSRYLRAFEIACDEVAGELPEEEWQMCTARLRAIFLKLTDIYEKRDEAEQAYFAYMIRRLEPNWVNKDDDAIMQMMERLVVSQSPYVRENALQAIYLSGSKTAVMSAFEKMNDFEIIHSDKLLTDGLGMFSGDKRELADYMWSRRESLSLCLVLPIMKFIRFSMAGFEEVFYELLKNPKEEKELRLEAIRYLRRYPYEPARKYIQNQLRYVELIEWEYGAMAALALSVYPGRDTEQVLKKGLRSHNWYVRINSAQSLVSGLKLANRQLADVYNGNDRYAREILMYVEKTANLDNQELGLRENYV